MTRVLCLYFSQPLVDIQSVAEVFYRATPTISWRAPFALFLEISKCRALYKEATFLARTRATLRRIGLEANLAVADDIGTALGLALFRVNDKEKLPVEAISFYVDPLGHNADSAVGNNAVAVSAVVEMARTLRLMGVKTIGDFLNVPVRELASRFSRLGLLAHLRAQGQMPVVWPSFSPREQVTERFAFDEEAPAENLQAVYFPLRPMIERVILRLRSRGVRIRQMDIILRQEHATKSQYTMQPHVQERRLALHIQLPYVSGNAIFQILREKLESHIRQNPLTSRISDVRLEIIETAPYSLTQKNIFDQKKEETEEALFQLVNRLATRLGPESVFFADPHANYLPEKNWQKVKDSPAEPQDAATTHSTSNWSRVPERPLRLLPKPVPLGWTSEQWTVIHKEVLLTDWWEPHSSPLPLERVYFRLASKNPSVPDLWVCQSPKGYFLHGVFE